VHPGGPGTDDFASATSVAVVADTTGTLQPIELAPG
jgi:hypothetical protein